MSRSNVPSPQADEFSNAVTSHNHPFPTSPDQNSPRLAFAIAMVNIPMLPSELLRLAWLSLDSQEGREYWKAMELMGQYAAANHAASIAISPKISARACCSIWKTTTRHRRARDVGHHSRLNGIARLRRERQRKRRITRFRLARHRPRHEPESGQPKIQLEGREPFPARRRRHPHQRRPR